MVSSCVRRSGSSGLSISHLHRRHLDCQVVSASQGPRSSTAASWAGSIHQGAYTRRREMMAQQIRSATSCGCIVGMCVYSFVGAIIRVRTRGR